MSEQAFQVNKQGVGTMTPRSSAVYSGVRLPFRVLGRSTR